MVKIFPTPKSEKYSGRSVRIGRISESGASITVKGEGELLSAAAARIERALLEKAAILPPHNGAYPITLTVDPDCKELVGKGDEAYSLSVGDAGAELIALTDRGALWAAVTLAELMTLEGERLTLPICSITDYPVMKKRGVFIEDRFNDFMTLEDWRTAIDYYSDLKLNTLVVGLYGCWGKQYDGVKSEYLYLDFKKHPELVSEKPVKYYSAKRGGWVNIPPRKPCMAEEDFFPEVIAYGKSRGMEVIPLFNSLGHNSLIPRLHPEISSLDENGNRTGVGICVRDEAAFGLMTELLDEIIDRYLTPSGISSIYLGLDEVTYTCKCERCAAHSFEENMTDYTVALIKHMKEKGMKNVYIYYDMFFYQFDCLDERFVKTLKDNDVYDVTVIDWWNYGSDVDFFRGKGDKVNSLFRSVVKPMSGYENWNTFSDTTRNISWCAEVGQRLGYEGMISYTTYDPIFDLNYRYLSEAAWHEVTSVDDHKRFAREYISKYYPSAPDSAIAAWERIQYRLNPYNYTENPPSNGEFLPYKYSYVASAVDHYPRDHVSEIIGKMTNEGERYLTYLKDFVERSDGALAFFAGEDADASAVNEAMKLNIGYLNVNAKELLALFDLRADCEAGRVSAAEAIAVIDRLINKRKQLMLAVENYRPAVTYYHTLRLYTLNLEALFELRARLSEQKERGEAPVLDLTKTVDMTAPVFKFLR